MPTRIKLECRGRLRSVVVSSRRPDGRVKRERANPITPIVDMTSGHVHYVRLGPAVRHAAGRTLAYFHEGQIHIRPEYAENLVFYEELCRLGDPTRGVEPSPKSWAKFETLREVLYKGVQPQNMPKDFYHPHVVELRRRGNSVPMADMAEVLAALEAVEGRDDDNLEETEVDVELDDDDGEAERRRFIKEHLEQQAANFLSES